MNRSVGHATGRLLGMKRILLMTVAVLAGIAAVNAAVDRTRNCACLDDCWCKTRLGTPCEMVGARTLRLVVISERLNFCRLPPLSR